MAIYVDLKSYCFPSRVESFVSYPSIELVRPNLPQSKAPVGIAVSSRSSAVGCSLRIHALETQMFVGLRHESTSKTVFLHYTTCAENKIQKYQTKRRHIYTHRDSEREILYLEVDQSDRRKAFRLMERGIR